MKNLALLAAATVLGTGIALAAPAHAGLILQIATGGKTFTINDGDPTDLSNKKGVVSYNNSYNGWTFNATAYSKPKLGSAFEPEIDLSGGAVLTGGGTRSITFKLTDTNFKLSGNVEADSGIGGTMATTKVKSVTVPAATVNYSTYADNSNSPFGTGTLLGSTAGLTGNPKAFADEIEKLVKLGHKYSLTEIITITQTAKGATSFDADVSLTAVPEPGTLALLGSGLLGVGMIGRRKRKAA